MFIRLKQPSPIKSLWGDFWHEGEIAVLHGEFNIGKTQLAMQIATQIAHNDKVLLIDTELSDIQFAIRFPGNHPKNLLRAELARRADDREIVDAIAIAVQEHRVKTIIISSFSMMADNVKCAMKHILDLRKTMGVSILLLNHLPKGVTDCMDISKWCDVVMLGSKTDDRREMMVDIKKVRRRCFMKSAVYKLDFPY